MKKTPNYFLITLSFLSAIFLFGSLNFDLLIPLNNNLDTNSNIFIEGSILSNLLSYDYDDGFLKTVILGTLSMPIIFFGLQSIGNFFNLIKKFNFIKNKVAYTICVFILVGIYVILEMFTIAKYAGTALSFVDKGFWGVLGTFLLWLLVICAFFILIINAFFPLLVDFIGDVRKDKNYTNYNHKFGTLSALLYLCGFMLLYKLFVLLDWSILIGLTLFGGIVIIIFEVYTLITAMLGEKYYYESLDRGGETVKSSVRTYTPNTSYSYSNNTPSEEKSSYYFNDGTGDRELTQDIGNPNIWYDSRGNKVVIDERTGHWHEL